MGNQSAVGTLVATFGKFAAFACLIAAGLSAVREATNRLVLNRQDSLESLSKLHWKTFEDILAEIFRRKGYSVKEQLGGGADGGIDLALRKDGKTTLVQCKRWADKAVGAPVVRELYGIMASENADEGILVTTSKFTKECQSFAQGKPIKLIDGETLLPLVRSVQKRKTGKANESAWQPHWSNETPSHTCKLCGSPMVLRNAKKGANAGKQFWGCSTFPKCRNTEKSV